MEGTIFTALNREQQSTVRNILSSADNLPYVLYGPPGTGKTRTIVGAIEQVVRTTNKNVLVCAMSNSACDEIAERLANVLKNHEVFRMYAKSYRHSSVCETVKSISNWDNKFIRLPSLEQLYKYRVVCTTIATAGCFTRARVSKDIWRPDHFGYVFIDECASSSETMTWIPIAGKISNNLFGFRYFDKVGTANRRWPKMTCWWKQSMFKFRKESTIPQKPLLKTISSFEHRLMHVTKYGTRENSIGW